MVHKLTLVFFLLIAPSLSAHGNLEFVNGLWFDGTRFEKKTMYSVNNVFRSSYDGETREIDLAGRYVIPPLADAHNHAFADGADFDAQLARYFGAGIFYVKNPNNILRLTAPYRARVNKPESVDVRYSNGGITSRGGHPTQIYAQVVKQIPNWGAPDMENQAYFIADTPEELAQRWPLILEGKPDFIKVYLEGSRGVSPAVLRSVIERADAAKLTVSAHVTSTEDFHEAVIAGVDEITHLPLAPIDAEDAALAATKRITVVTTTLSHRPSPGVADLPALHRTNLELLKKHGVNVILGVDGGPTVLDELQNVARLGVYTNAELLQIATLSTPRAIFPGRQIGRLADGYEASFITVESNPLESLDAIRRVAFRFKQGHVIELAPQKPGVAEAILPILMQKGVAAAMDEYRRLEREERQKWDFAERQLNQLGYALLQHGKTADAITIFAFNAGKFPHSANVWDSLAEGHMKAGDKAKAIEFYEKSLALNPNNKNAIDMLKKLRGSA